MKIKNRKWVEMELQKLSLAFENLFLAKKTLEDAMEILILLSTVLNFFLFLGISLIIIHTWREQNLNHALVFVPPQSLIKFFFLSWSSDRVQKQVGKNFLKK